MKPWELQTLLAYLEYSGYRSTWQWHTYNARGVSRGRWYASTPKRRDV